MIGDKRPTQDIIQRIYDIARQRKGITSYSVWRISLSYYDEVSGLIASDWESNAAEVSPKLLGLPVVWDTRDTVSIIAIETLPKPYMESTMGTATPQPRKLEAGWWVDTDKHKTGL